MLIEFLVEDSETFTVAGYFEEVESYSYPYGGVGGYTVFRAEVDKPEQITVTDRHGLEWMPIKLEMNSPNCGFVTEWECKRRFKI